MIPYRKSSSTARGRSLSRGVDGFEECSFGDVCKAGCSAMAISQAGTLTETPFCIRQLEQEKIIKEMIG